MLVKEGKTLLYYLKGKRMDKEKLFITELFKKSDAKSLNEFIGRLDDEILDRCSYSFCKTSSLDKVPEEEFRDSIKEIRKKNRHLTDIMNAYVSEDLAHLYIELCKKDKDLLDGEVEHNLQVVSLRIRLSIEMMKRKGLCTLIKEYPEGKWDPSAGDVYKVKGSLVNDEHLLSFDGDGEREIHLSGLIIEIIEFSYKQKEEYDDGFKIYSNGLIEYILNENLPTRG